MTAAELLAMRLIAKSMNMDDIRWALARMTGKQAQVSQAYAKSVIAQMRKDVLPELGAWCPRATYETGYLYRVLDQKPEGDDLKLQQLGAAAMFADNYTRLTTMLETARPYADVLDKRSMEGRKAQVYVKAADAALAALALIG